MEAFHFFLREALLTEGGQWPLSIASSPAGEDSAQRRACSLKVTLNAGGRALHKRGGRCPQGPADPSGPQSTPGREGVRSGEKAVVSLGPGACGLRK